MHQGAGHATKLEMAAHVSFEHLFDNLVDISTGAKGVAGAGYDDRLDRIIRLERGHQVTQLGIDVKGERIEHVRSIEGDRRHPFMYIVVEIKHNRVVSWRVGL